MKPLCVVSCPIDTFSGYGARSRDFVKSLIELKDKELNQEAAMFTAKQEQRAQEKVLDSQIQEERMNVQKGIADDKLDVAIERLKQQADLKLFELENKIKGLL